MKNQKTETLSNQTIEEIVIECATEPSKRSQLFSQIGQQYLKSLHGRELEEQTYEVFQLILKHEKDWKGMLLVPLYYRSDKVNNVYRDIWYTLKDYVAWCFLYPTEVDQYFKHDESGKVEILANPKERLVERDNTKDVYKSELGKEKLVKVKKERTFEIDSGFNLGQKDSILNVVVAGLIALPEDYQKKVKAKEAKQKTDSESQEDKKEVKKPKKKAVQKTDVQDNIEVEKNIEPDKVEEVKPIKKKSSKKALVEGETKENAATDKEFEVEITKAKKPTKKKLIDDKAEENVISPNNSQEGDKLEEVKPSKKTIKKKLN